MAVAKMKKRSYLSDKSSLPDVRKTPHIRIREGLWEHIQMGKINPHDFTVYCTLLKWARWETGICYTSAASIASNWADLNLQTTQKCLRRLREKGYIKYPEGSGKRGVYPVLIDKYEPQYEELTGWSLNAFESHDYDNPVYDYISGTPYGEAYGEDALQDTLCMGCVGAASALRLPLLSIYQLTNKAIKQSNNPSFSASPKEKAEDNNDDELA